MRRRIGVVGIVGSTFVDSRVTRGEVQMGNGAEVRIWNVRSAQAASGHAGHAGGCKPTSPET